MRAAVARALERGALRGPVARGLSRVWERVSDPVRPLALPPGTCVIGVGGATLGGSGKTPLVRTLAEHLGDAVVVASGYTARVRAKRVRRDDDVALVGDEALFLARALDAPVVVGRRRQDAVDLAAELGSTIVVDGLLQARPERLALSILVLDADAPWGAGACPPAGDLRARREALLAAADVVARPEAELVVPPDLEGARLGVVLAVARPERILFALERRGIRPALVLLFPDHARLVEPSPSPEVDAWLTTGKCATKLGPSFGGAPVRVLEHRIRLPKALVEAVAACRNPVLESAPCPRTESRKASRASSSLSFR